MLARGSRLTKERELCCAVLAGCSKWPDFSPAQPRRLFHPPTPSLPRQTLCPGPRLVPCKAAASDHLLPLQGVAGMIPTARVARAQKIIRLHPLRVLRARRAPGRSLSFFSILLGFAGGGQGLVDFPDEAPFNFRDLLCAHAEDASTLGQFFEVGLNAETGDIRRERVKRQHELIP